MKKHKMMSDKHMKDLLATVSFILCFVLTLNILSLFFMPKSSRSDSSVTKYTTKCFKGERSDSIDVFLVGDSNVYRAVSPQVLWDENGTAACVSGRGAQSPHGAYKILKEMYKTQSPSLIVIETDMFYASTGDMQSRMRIFGKRVKYALRDFENSALNAIGYYFPVIEYHNRWDSIHSPDIINYKGSYRASLKGFVPDSTVESYDGGFDYMGSENATPESFSRFANHTLTKMINMCRKNGSEVLLVSVPSATSWNYARHNKMVAVAQNNNVNYLDLNVEGSVKGFDWTTDTKDGGDHLNTSGAVKASQALSSYITSTYSAVPDRRNDVAYRQWGLTFKEAADGLTGDFDLPKSSDPSSGSSSSDGIISQSASA